jgi:hypothetical protein
LEAVVEEAQLEPCVKADQLQALNLKEWRGKPPREEFFSCECPSLCAYILEIHQE